MDVKSRVITKIDELLSEYNEEKESLGPFMKGKGSTDNSYRVSGAIKALKKLKTQIETIKPEPDFLGQVRLQINVTEEILCNHTLYPSGTYLDAKPGITEAFDLVKQYLCHLETEFEG